MDEEMLMVVQQDAIGILSKYFRIFNLPKPMKIEVRDNDGLAAGIFLNGKKEISMMINKRKHTSSIDLETSCVHETGHYLHILKDSWDFDHGSYERNELVACASSFIYFEEKKRFDEFEKYVCERYNPSLYGVQGCREKAILEMIKKGETSKSILEKTLANHPKVLTMFEEMQALISNLQSC